MENSYEFVKYDGTYLHYTVSVPPTITNVNEKGSGMEFLKEYENFYTPEYTKIASLSSNNRYAVRVRCNKRANAPYVDKLKYFLNIE